MENHIAINPEDFYSVSSTLGWEIIYGCVVTHFSLGPGIIKSVDDLLHIQFFDDPEGEERRFYPCIFIDGKIHDLEVSQKIVQSIEETLGFSIKKIDAKIARNRSEMIRKLELFKFDQAEELFQEAKDRLEIQDIQHYQTKKSECEKKYAIEQNKELLEKTLQEIDEKLKDNQFSEAKKLFNTIAHLYSEDEFEQLVLSYQIPFELSQFNFAEADKLFARCTSNTVINYIDQKKEAIQSYFNKPETKVTQEQALALADQSNALLIKARAGSGKTRVLASKTALLIDRYKVNPDKILVLAFNKKAAREIGGRIQKVYGMESFENARTFHSLAFQLVKFNGDILFDNQGDFSRPALTNFVQDILRSIWSPQIQTNLYLLFRKEMHSLEQSGGLLSNADYLAFIRNKRDITLNGDRVKSTGEKFIADYLFEHDIPFFYERVEFWSGHSYRPDFSLFPEAGQVIVEFWGIDEHDSKKSIPRGWGVTWEQYHAEMEEKRAFWKEKEIPLVEMSMADIRHGREQFEQILNDRLAEVGIRNEKLPQKDLENKVIRNQKDRMTELFVQFIQRAKKRMWTVEQVQNKVREYKTNDERTRLFLNLGCQVYSAYQKELEKRNSIDFDDLIIKASELIQNSKGNCTLDLGLHKDRRIKIKDIEWILVDEFQDFSNEFNYMLQAIFSQNPNAHLVCVGDDWQAINSFAGSDTTYFNQFSDHFQNGNTVTLLTNHRSQKAIVDFGNKVMFGQGEPGTATADHLGGKVETQTIDEIWIESREGISYENEREFDQRFIFYEHRENGRKINDNGFLQAKYLKACYQIIKEPNNWDLISKNKTNQPVIAILSRTNYLYRVSLNEFLDKLKSCFSTEEMKIIGDFNHKIRISTVHGFKGLEAEIVIILRACDGSFPLLHPDNSLFEFFGQSEYQALEEERHLFYVGVSRPSQTLYILTEKGNESSFIK